MHKIYYNQEGWLCGLYPYNIQKDNDNHFIELNEDDYTRILSSASRYAWRYKNGELVNEKYEDIPLEETLERLRLLREDECFSVINRGQLWYNTLTEAQISELNEWYQQWLNLPNTYTGGEIVYPTKPSWLS